MHSNHPLLYLITLSSLISGCAGMNSEFECKQPPGIHCKSLNEVNALIDSGQLAHNEAKPTQTKLLADSPTIADVGANSTSAELILPDIWLTSYEDTSHYLHSGHWLKAGKHSNSINPSNPINPLQNS